MFEIVYISILQNTVIVAPVSSKGPGTVNFGHLKIHHDEQLCLVTALGQLFAGRWCEVGSDWLRKTSYYCFLFKVAVSYVAMTIPFLLQSFRWSIIALVCLVGLVWFCFVWLRLLVCLFGLLQVHCISRLLELETVPSHPGGWPFECWECSALAVHGERIWKDD